MKSGTSVSFVGHLGWYLFHDYPVDFQFAFVLVLLMYNFDYQGDIREIIILIQERTQFV